MAEKLGALLVRKGLINQGQLEEALKAQMIYGARLGTNLVELEYLDLETLGAVLSEQSRYPQATIAEFEAVTSATLSAISAELAEKHFVFPLAVDGRKLKLAMASPTDMAAVDELSFTTGLRIIPCVVPELRLYLYLEKRYGIVRPERYIKLDSESSKTGAGARLPGGAPATAAAGAPGAPAGPRPAAPEGSPQKKGMFGGLAPGQFLSDDEEGGKPGARANPAPAPVVSLERASLGELALGEYLGAEDEDQAQPAAAPPLAAAPPGPSSPGVARPAGAAPAPPQGGAPQPGAARPGLPPQA